jgi:hypothetical protein
VAGGRGRSRRVSVPGVAELLRPAVPLPDTSDERQATGRERHDQKITVYLSALADLDTRGKDSLVARRIKGTRDSDEDTVTSLAWAKVQVER